MRRLEPVAALTLALVPLIAVGCAAAPYPEEPQEAIVAAPQPQVAAPAAATATASEPHTAPPAAAAPATADGGLIQVREPVGSADAPPPSPPAAASSPAGRTVEELADELERTRRQRNRLQVELAAAQREATIWRQRAEKLAAGSAPAPAGEPADVPEPEPPAPVAAAAPTEPQPPTDPLARVVPAVYAWADAWSGQRVEEYLSAYARGFRPPEGLSRPQWEAMRRERLLAPRFIRVEISSLRAVPAGDEGVEVSFRQSYVSNRFRDTVTKQLLLVEEEGEWRIASEQVIR